jgi:hypothetical protein
MRTRHALGLGAALLASLGLASNAYAIGEAKGDPANTLTYSAESIAANANHLVIPESAFNFIVDVDSAGTATVNITVFAPPGSTFTLPTTTFFDCGPHVTGGNSTTSTSTVALNGTATSFTTTGLITCASGDHVHMNQNPAAGIALNGVNALSSGGGEVTIYAQVTGGGFANDSAPFPLITLLSRNVVEATSINGNTQLVDLSGTGGTTPGSVFSVTAPQANTAGALGFFKIAAVDLLNATTGGPLAFSGAGFTLASFTGETATITGNFPSITGAYLVPGSTVATSCVAAAPAGSISASTVSATQLVFPVAPPANFATRVFYEVCVLTPGTIAAPIQATTTTILISENVIGMTPRNLTALNQPFGSIQNNGVAALFQNVFGAANFYPTFFRASNQGTASAPVFAVFHFDNTATFGLCTNPVPIVGATPLAAGNAAFIAADAVATCVGQALTAGSAHATVRLMSPSASVLFSAVSQNQTTGNFGDLSALP